ncbi:hypothetical protein C8Q80DRAFT_1272986 [Daedaleopsis nitida]|nr:hypothetical protein C8Q80DRAFT_1272986 [Daedaleopsis nitida]
MSAPAPSPVPLVLIAGPPLLGFFLAWALQGVLTLQTYLYYLHFPKDRLGLKSLVYFVLVFEWVHAGLTTQTAFEIYGSQYGSLSSLTGVHNFWFSSAIMSAIIAGVVECFYARRIWLLSRSKVLVILIVFLAFAQTVLGIAGGITLHVLNLNASAQAVDKILSSTGYIVATVDDIIIAIAMAYFLLRSKTGIRKSDDMLNRLARLVIETGALTSIVSLLTSVLMLHGSNTLLFECPALVLPKLYSNTLLMSLNNRAYLKAGDTVTTDTNFTPAFPTIPSTSVAFAGRNTTETYDLDPISTDEHKTTLELYPRGSGSG